MSFRRLSPLLFSAIALAALLPITLPETSTSSAPQPPAATASRASVRYGWPSGHAVKVLQTFDPPAQKWGAGHRGVDLALPAGAPVYAAADGIVAFAGQVAHVPVISIDHADGIRTTYEPVTPQVTAGQSVTKGQQIGILLAGHRSDGIDALHWGARTSKSTYVDPLRLLSPAIIRLKPLEEPPT